MSNRNLIGEIRPFYEWDDWNIYYEQLDQFLAVNEIPKEKHTAFLLGVCVGPYCYKVLRDLCHPVLPKEKTFDEICDLLKKHFVPQVAVFRERIKFCSAKQDADEEVKAWYARLKSLSVDCRFGELLPSILLDKFVTGLRSGAILDRLCEENETMTLQEALEIAISKEAALEEPYKEEIIPVCAELLEDSVPPRRMCYKPAQPPQDEAEPEAMELVKKKKKTQQNDFEVDEHVNDFMIAPTNDEQPKTFTFGTAGQIKATTPQPLQLKDSPLFTEAVKNARAFAQNDTPSYVFGATAEPTGGLFGQTVPQPVGATPQPCFGTAAPKSCGFGAPITGPVTFGSAPAATFGSSVPQVTFGAAPIENKGFAFGGAAPPLAVPSFGAVASLPGGAASQTFGAAPQAFGAAPQISLFDSAPKPVMMKMMRKSKLVEPEVAEMEEETHDEPPEPQIEAALTAPRRKRGCRGGQNRKQKT